MKTINSNTKISTLLKEQPGALETIISISPKFTKLRNPLLRKLMASRTSITMAAKIGGCSTEDFFTKLEPLGFMIDRETKADEQEEQKQLPAFLQNSTKEMMAELDVRSVIDSGKDPLNLILQQVKQLQPGQVLKLINSFEPVPLIKLLGRQGFESYTDTINENLVHTYFYQNTKTEIKVADTSKATDGWDEMLQQFNGKTETIDVRHLEMPLPMHTILEALDQLAPERALYVHHKRIPVFLLPELADRKLDYRVKEINDSEVDLLIFKA